MRVISTSLAAIAAVALAACMGAQASKPAPVAEIHSIDVTGMDTSIAPGDDFNAYANGNWIKATEIPADQSSWGAFAILRDEAAARTLTLIEAAAKSNAPDGSEAQKVGDYYASYMDETAIEAKGLAPLQPQLAAIAAIKDGKSLARALGASVRADVDPLNNTNFYTENLFGLWTSPGLEDSAVYTPYLLQGGLGMPDREYYLASSTKMAANRDAYKAHVAAVLKLANMADADARAARVLALETEIAKAHVSRADSEDVLKANNPWKREDFAKKAPGLDWTAFFAGADLSHQPNFIVWQPGAVSGIAEVVKATPIATWKDYLTFHLLNHYSSVLPKAFVDERFAFYGRVLSGTPQLQDRWKRAVAYTNVALGDAVGQLYAQRYFPPEAKAAAQAMVANIKSAFAKRIDALDWMSPATKAQAKEKVATLYVGIGYPDKWTDYSALAIANGDAYGNARRAELFEYNRQIARLGKAVDRTQWSMTPQTVNAVNLPLQNALNFPAAILEKPFFDAKADPAFNYGAIGAVIGHEISHSFDDQGSQFDAQGRLHNWWTPQDFAHFKASAAQLAAQYDAYAPFSDAHVNGQQTLGENIADVAGLSASYDGWVASLAGNPEPTIQGFTGKQIFFLAYAQTRRVKTREPALRQQLLTDGHAPAQYRAQAVRNIDGWYDAFGAKPGQSLYLGPNDRVRVW
ncbi:MAG: M13 family metallopeptidase [Proteobacteria bacterium]|nr:M13 family metallopeptidase [Pseudomonadota bacterium]